MADIVRPLIGAFVLAIAPLPAFAQQDAAEGDVLEVVEGFMEGLGNKDADVMRGFVTEDAYLALVRPMPDGQADRTQSMRMDDAVTSLGNAPGDIAEPLGDVTVMVDGPVAMAWAPFGFYLDGNRTHCGVNIFTLMRVDGEWRIATVTYSHLTQGCEDAPTP